MSLINDALKRARDAERQKGSAPPKVPLQPVDYASRRAPSSQWLVLVLILLALGFSVLSFLKWSREKPAPAQAQLRTNASVRAPVSSLPAPTTSVAAPKPLPRPTVQVSTTVLARTESRPLTAVPSAAPPGAEPSSPGAAGSAPIGSTPGAGLSSATTEAAAAAPALTNASGAATNTATADPDRPPDLRLQSIIYRLRNPSVVINGEMLRVGDPIAGGRVTEIQRHAVTVRWKETNLVLQLPRL